MKPSFFRAFVWMRWRLTVNSLRVGRGRDRLERLSRLTNLLTPVVLVLLMVPLLLASAAGGACGGWFAAQAGDPRDAALTVLRLVLLPASALALLMPVFAVLGGASYQHARLLLLPIPRWKLYAGEVASRLGDPVQAWLVPGLALFPLGLLAGGAPLAAGVAAVSGCALLALLLVSQALVGFAVGLVLRDRRRGELLTVAVTIAVATVGLAGGFIGDRLGEGARGEIAVDAPRALPRALELLPSELHARAVRAALERRPGGAAWRVGLLLVGLAGTHLLARGLHGRLLERPAAGGGARRRSEVRVRAWRLPGVRPAVAAVAAAHARAARRSASGKVALLFPPLFSVLMAVMVRGKLERLPAGFPIPPADLLACGVLVLCVLMSQQELVNLFARDGAGLTLQWIQPLGERELVRGKLLGAMAAGLGVTACALALAGVILRGVSPPHWASLALIGCATFCWTAPLGAILSALLPKKVDPSRLKEARPHQGAALIAVLTAMILTGTPAAAALLLRLYAGPWVTLGLSALWAALSAAGGLALTEVARRLVAARRENLALIVQGS